MHTARDRLPELCHHHLAAVAAAEALVGDLCCLWHGSREGVLDDTTQNTCKPGGIRPVGRRDKAAHQLKRCSRPYSMQLQAI
jgi:hypothetical protein